MSSQKFPKKDEFPDTVQRQQGPRLELIYAGQLDGKRLELTGTQITALWLEGRALEGFSVVGIQYPGEPISYK